MCSNSGQAVQGTEGGGHNGHVGTLALLPLQPVLTGMVLGRLATDRGGRQGVSMNGAGNIAGLVDEVLPAAAVVERMATEAAARLSAR